MHWGDYTKYGKGSKNCSLFRIEKSDLLDDKLDSNAKFDAPILTAIETMTLIQKYYTLPIKDKETIFIF